jgi:PD-(D/E)XK endonuclease
MVLAALVGAGFLGSPGVHGNSRYDLVIEAGGRLLRVKVKSASRCG